MEIRKLAANDNEDIVEDNDFVAHRAELSDSTIEGEVPMEREKLAANDNEDVVEDD